MCLPGGGTRDLCGPTGLTTSQFVAAVKQRVEHPIVTTAVDHVAAGKAAKADDASFPVDPYKVDYKKMREMFDSIDVNKSGRIDFEEFVVAMKRLGIAPRVL
jgi:hypothetical protein